MSVRIGIGITFHVTLPSDHATSEVRVRGVHTRVQHRQGGGSGNRNGTVCFVPRDLGERRLLPVGGVIRRARVPDRHRCRRAFDGGMVGKSRENSIPRAQTDVKDMRANLGQGADPLAAKVANESVNGHRAG